jgi:hypothetical protein
MRKEGENKFTCFPKTDEISGLASVCKANNKTECLVERKKKGNRNGCSFFRFSGNVLSYREVSHQVFLAMQSLTSVFGMRTGGPLLYCHQRWYI